ncbi:putative Cell division protein DivIB [[Clostridium] ultunense Esp]|uniref:Putative Cell division protein DivIB n=1 Tax=[Clostridium] ultunense Esp TaxID=1288971 RepID=M1YZ34_9FIRM|nr:FtsQ-type POTRA domain-containing protein [Schnuerera ultunensis]CCQ95845.1 putative Cell division protein DivIB [[Clostridium] ultunense Esp]SHD77284.1 putative Cell division protein DivIB [[Clostridium] ultunense Esp]
MKKRKNSKRRVEKRKRILKFLLFVLILILLYLFAFKTNFFSIRNIEVVGNKKTSYDQVIKASMCNKGENIFKINKKKGKESLERLPYIREARIKRKLPKGIIIQIDERKEIAVIPYIGSFVYVDKEGYILAVEKKIEEASLPQIFGLKLEDFELGSNLYSLLKREGIEEFIAYSQQSNLLSLMKYINFTDNNNTMIELKDGIKVAFGPLNNVKYKLSFLNNILEDIDEKDINVKKILLNKGDNPIVVTDDR